MQRGSGRPTAAGLEPLDALLGRAAIDWNAGAPGVGVDHGHVALVGQLRQQPRGDFLRRFQPRLVLVPIVHVAAGVEDQRRGDGAS